MNLPKALLDLAQRLTRIPAFAERNKEDAAIVTLAADILAMPYDEESQPWFDENGITVSDMAGLLAQAHRPQFGRDGPSMPLVSWLLCEAFERRFSPDESRALHLAAMIVSRAVIPPA